MKTRQIAGQQNQRITARLQQSGCAKFCNLILVVFLSIWLAACTPQPANSIGEAFVAPATLNLRRDLSQKASTAAVLKYGDRVDVIDVRRRFLRVRTKDGVVGWIDAAQLLSPEQMDQIRKDTQAALALPSEGSATVFEALNIHLEPSRQSPAFARIPDTGSVAVLAHRLVPKATGPVPVSSLTLLKPNLPNRKQRKDKQSRNSVQRPPKPPAPKAPLNWQELSSERIDGSESTADAKLGREKEKAGKQNEQDKKPMVYEDWTLVRTKEKQCGWVLSRNLVLSIPDEVAQYAEGKHITSYFDLGSVTDEEKGLKHHWLWTTSSGALPFDFDSWRVFLWNRHRHRYETSFRQRDIEGYFPVHVDSADATSLGRTFQLILKDENGKFSRNSYLFDGSRVHLTAKEEFHPGATPSGNKAGGLDVTQIQARLPQPGWFRRHWDAIRHRFGKED